MPWQADSLPLNHQGSLQVVDPYPKYEMFCRLGPSICFKVSLLNDSNASERDIDIDSVIKYVCVRSVMSSSLQLCFKRYKHIFEVLPMYIVREVLIGKYIGKFFLKKRKRRDRKGK